MSETVKKNNYLWWKEKKNHPSHPDAWHPMHIQADGPPGPDKGEAKADFTFFPEQEILIASQKGMYYDDHGVVKIRCKSFEQAHELIEIILDVTTA